MDQEPESSADTPAGKAGITPSSPPPSGLAKSIRRLFEGRDSKVPQGTEEKTRSPELGSGEVRSDTRDRFVTRVANYLRSESQGKSRLAPLILEDSLLLRREGGHNLILDAVTSLLADSGTSTSEEIGSALAEQLMDPLLAHYLALRVSSEGEGRSRESLAAIVHSFPSLTAPALAEILAQSTDHDARQILRGLLIDTGGYGKAAALNLIGDSRWYAVRQGVRLLADLGDGETVQALTPLLAHADPRVRKETVIALAAIGGEDAKLLVVGMLDDPHAEVREGAASAVGDLRAPRALRRLLEMLASEEDESVQAKVLLALGRIGDPGAVPAIERKAAGSVFSRPSQPVRVAAYHALAAIGTPHARSVVEAGAEDRDPEIRATVKGLLSATAEDS